MSVATAGSAPQSSGEDGSPAMAVLPVDTMDLLRFAAVGSVDDGKSTLIGRLLFDTRQLFDDQLEAVQAASLRRGVGEVDLSFITDGLRAEREQGITIDVAYRYAATPRRKFVIADCPGHVQYTRNMATGASTADLALVVVDATSGLREQTRRHTCIAALLGVDQIIVCANKMDLVDWDQEAYNRVADEMSDLARCLGIASCTVIPVSALFGDNVVDASSAAPWYDGPTGWRLGSSSRRSPGQRCSPSGPVGAPTSWRGSKLCRHGQRGNPADRGRDHRSARGSVEHHRPDRDL
jgi:small GTP-binding protein